MPEDNGWVITTMGRMDTERIMGPVVDILKEHCLELDYIQLLSQPYAKAHSTGSNKPARGYGCAEFHAYGSISDEAHMRVAYAAFAQEEAADIAIQREASYRIPKKLFCFDMDSTLIQGEVIDELAKMAGVADRVVAITAAAMRGEIEFQESFRRRVALLQGLPGKHLEELLDKIPLMEGAERLFRTLKRRGAKSAVLSGGFTFFGNFLKEELSIDHVFANELHVDAHGCVSGEVKSQIVDGARKAELLQEIAHSEGIPLSQVVAVGDGANDLPMLRLAGMGVAFHAKPAVRSEARFSLSHLGLDSLLYLLGIPDSEWAS